MSCGVLSSAYGTHATAKVRSWPWLAGRILTSSKLLPLRLEAMSGSGRDYFENESLGGSSVVG